jgi:DNA recombination protein RmuC
VLAGAALKDNQTSFLEVAKQVLDGHKHAADQDLEKRQQAVETMLQPVQQTLEEYKRNLQELEKSRQTAFGSISQELKHVVEAQGQVRTEAARLVNALRPAPQA